MAKKKAKRYFIHKKYLSIVLYLLLLLLAVYALKSVFFGKTTGSPSVKVEQKNIKEDNPSKRYTIDVQYPEVIGLNDADFQQQINTEIKERADGEISEFKKENATPPKIKGLEDAKAQLFIKYSTTKLDEQIVSIGLEKYEYSIGQAHGTTNTTTFNYSVKNRKKLSLTDLFVPGCDCWQKLSKIARSAVTENLGKDGGIVDNDLVAAGTAPKAENYQIFLLDNNSLILIFDPYQVAPGATGTVKISIPFSQLRGILKI